MMPIRFLSDQKIDRMKELVAKTSVAENSS